MSPTPLECSGVGHAATSALSASGRVTHVLFDFDGTLACTTPAVVECYRHAFAVVLGQDYPRTDDDMTEMLRARLRELCERKGGDRADELFRAFREHYVGPLDAPPTLYDGVLDMFDALRRRGVTVGLVTNKTRLATEHEIVRCGLDGVAFACRVTADDAARGKPDPLPLLLGLQALGCAPEETLYVGDGMHDIVAARRAGIRAVGAAYGDWGREQLAAENPAAVIDAPRQLVDVIDALNAGARAGES